MKYETLSQFETGFGPSCAGPLPVADRLELRRLVDNLYHASAVTDTPFLDTSRVDAAFKAFRRVWANLKRRAGARDRLTSKRLMGLPDDAWAILLSSIAFFFRDKVDVWSEIDFGNDRHAAMLEACVTSSLAKLTNPSGRPINEPFDVFFLWLRDLYEEDNRQHGDCRQASANASKPI